MRAKESLLVLNNFSILESECSIIPWAKDSNHVGSLNHPVDIDFKILTNKENKNKHIIITTVELNSDKEPGYYARVKGVGEFVISDSSTSEKVKNQLILFSGVSICITNIRSYIANITSYYPLGKYNFSTIDINDLVNQKMKQNAEKG